MHERVLFVFALSILFFGALPRSSCSWTAGTVVNVCHDASHLGSLDVSFVRITAPVSKSPRLRRLFGRIILLRPA